MLGSDWNFVDSVFRNRPHSVKRRILRLPFHCERQDSPYVGQRYWSELASEVPFENNRKQPLKGPAALTRLSNFVSCYRLLSRSGGLQPPRNIFHQQLEAAATVLVSGVKISKMAATVKLIKPIASLAKFENGNPDPLFETCPIEFDTTVSASS